METDMYRYYCKDENCQGHTKSWERCCDLRAFANRETIKANPFQAAPMFKTAPDFKPTGKQVFA